MAQSPIPRSSAGSGSGAGLGPGQSLTRTPERGPGGTSQDSTGATSIESAQLRKGTTAGRLLPGAVVASSVNGEDGAQHSLRLTEKRLEGSELDSSRGGEHFAGAAWSWEGGPGKWAVGLSPGEEGDGAPRGGARQGGVGGVTVKGAESCFQINFFHTHFHSNYTPLHVNKHITHRRCDRRTMSRLGTCTAADAE